MMQSQLFQAATLHYEAVAAVSSHTQAKFTKNRLRSLPYRPRSLPHRLRSLPHRLRSLPYRPRSLPHRLRSLPHRLRSLPYRLRSLPHRLRSLPHRLRSLAEFTETGRDRESPRSPGTAHDHDRCGDKCLLPILCPI